MNRIKSFLGRKLMDENFYGKIFDVIEWKMQILGSVM